jgi:hypothetical protein
MICLSFVDVWMGETVRRSRGSSVSLVTRLRAGRPGPIPGRGRGFFSSPPRPDGLWGQPSLLANGYRKLFPSGKAVRA